MRYALVSDLHGNVIAVEAVLAAISRIGVDRTICLGDIATLGVRPREVIEMIDELESPFILGNHDDFLLDPALIHAYTEAPIVIEAVDWCREQLAADHLAVLARGLARWSPPEVDGRLLLFHGSPVSHMVDLLATTPPDELDARLSGHRAQVMAGGHTHLPMVRQHRGSLLVNPGSVGMPFLEYVNGGAPMILPSAQFAIVDVSHSDVSVTLHQLDLDIDSLRSAARASDNPLAPMLAASYVG